MANENNLKEEIIVAVRGELRSFREEVNDRFNEIDSRFDGIDSRFHEMDSRFDRVNQDLARLEIIMEDMDDKFSLITEGQDMIREVLETRVGNIEEILGVQSRA